MSVGVFVWVDVGEPRVCLVPKEPEEGVASPGTGVAYGCEPLCGCWEWNPCSLVEHSHRLHIG